MNTLVLKIWINREYKYHISLLEFIKIDENERKIILSEILNIYNKYFGYKNHYFLIIKKLYNSGCIIVDSYNPTTKINLKYLKVSIYRYIKQFIKDNSMDAWIKYTKYIYFPTHKINLYGNIDDINNYFYFDYYNTSIVNFSIDFL